MEFEERENLWRWRSKLAFAIGAPAATAGAVIVSGLAAGGIYHGGCISDHPCLTDRQHDAELGPNFDYDGGGTVLGTPRLGQKIVFSAPFELELVVVGSRGVLSSRSFVGGRKIWGRDSKRLLAVRGSRAG